MKHPHAPLIAALGGPARVAERLGFEGARPAATVSNWTRRGIPWRWRASVLALAKTDKVDVPADFMPVTAAAA